MNLHATEPNQQVIIVLCDSLDRLNEQVEHSLCGISHTESWHMGSYFEIMTSNWFLPQTAFSKNWMLDFHYILLLSNTDFTVSYGLLVITVH